ncbi:MAG: substrate-binding domain-containing protein [Desulfobacterales bacterium]
MNRDHEKTIRIASTTSVVNSGLMDVLIPAYEKNTCYHASVKVDAVGTGKAIRLAKQGQADLIFVHDPFREEKFVSTGYGVNRRIVMYNEFLIVGPGDDPAHIKKSSRAMGAFTAIAENAVAFVSRGDDSGTNIKEMDLWEDSGINPKGKGWYFETGLGMAQTLMAADQKKAYTLVDNGTFLHLRNKVKLTELFSNDHLLKNYYSIIAVNPGNYPHVNYREAMDFIAFLTSLEGQKVIGQYTRQGFSLFFPAVFFKPEIDQEVRSAGKHHGIV